MPRNPDSTATLSTVIQAAIHSALRDLHTSMPGIVQSFDNETQTASVQPAIKRVFRKEEEDTEILVPVDLPLCINVPVIFPRGGGFSLTFPVQPGDECLLVFCERSYDYWHESGGVQSPGARRFHSLSDAVAHVGLSSTPNKIPNFYTDGISLSKDDGTAKIEITGGEIAVTTDTIINLVAPNVKVTGNLEVTGTSTASDHISGGVSGSGHTHPFTNADSVLDVTDPPT